MPSACLLPSQSQDVPWRCSDSPATRREQGSSWEQKGFEDLKPSLSFPKLCRNGGSLSRASAPWALISTSHFCLPLAPKEWYECPHRNWHARNKHKLIVKVTQSCLTLCNPMELEVGARVKISLPMNSLSNGNLANLK